MSKLLQGYMVNLTIHGKQFKQNPNTIDYILQTKLMAANIVYFLAYSLYKSISLSFLVCYNSKLLTTTDIGYCKNCNQI